LGASTGAFMLHKREQMCLFSCLLRLLFPADIAEFAGG
jgi:hypothetical protein